MIAALEGQRDEYRAGLGDLESRWRAAKATFEPLDAEYQNRHARLREFDEAIGRLRQEVPHPYQPKHHHARSDVESLAVLRKQLQGEFTRGDAKRALGLTYGPKELLERLVARGALSVVQGDEGQGLAYFYRFVEKVENTSPGPQVRLRVTS
jgi:hypothetical protein